MQAILSHYRILEQIGAGGMGVVYRAHDERLDRDVALKVLPPGTVVETSARKRFHKEALTLSKLNHPNIATVHDFDTQDGTDFLVEELIEGLSLDAMLASGPLSEKEIINLGSQLAEGLAAAHEHGVIHRDLKPANVRVTPEARLKILDFGLAMILHGEVSPTAVTESLSETKGLVGTLPYMAPEQLLGSKLDARTDIWATGCVLYEMATGRRPFLGSGPALTEAILHQPPPALTKLNPKISAALDAVIQKCLGKDPEKRYLSAREIAADLRRVVSAPISVGMRLRLRQWFTVLVQTGAMPNKVELITGFGKRKHWLVVAIVVLAVVTAVFVTSWWMRREPIIPERGWVLISDFETSGDERIPDKGVREGLSIALEQSRYVNVFPRSRAYEVLQRMKKQGVSQLNETLSREICQRENLQVLLTGSIERLGPVFQITVRGLDPAHGNLLFGEEERFDRKDLFFDRVDSLAKKIRNDLGESLGGIKKTSRPLAKVTTTSLEALQLYSQAKDAKDQGKDEQVEGLLKGALQLDPEFAMAHMQLGQYYSEVVGKNERALAELERAYQLRHGVTDREQRRIEGGYYSLQERYEDEAQSLNVLVSLYPDNEEAHEQLAGAYYDLDQLDKAIAELREVLRLNSSSGSAYRTLVLYLARSNQAEAAIATALEAQQHGVDSPQMHWGLGLAYLGQDNVSMARQEFDRIGQGTETDRTLRDLCLAIADLYEGKLNTARTEITEQIQTVRAERGELQSFRRYLLGRIRLIQGSSQEAKLQADLILRMPSPGLQIVDLLYAGILYARAGRIEQAREILCRLDNFRKSVPSSWNQSCFHNLEGEIGMADAKLEEAENSFRAAAHESLQSFSHAGLARAYQAQKRWDLAAQEWEQVLHHKGEILQDDFPPDLACAHLQLARVYRQINNREIARSHYEEVLRVWQHADGLPLLKYAKSELEELTPEVRPGTAGPITKPK